LCDFAVHNDRWHSMYSEFRGAALGTLVAAHITHGDLLRAGDFPDCPERRFAHRASGCKDLDTVMG
jgi:hypothetical protein